MTYHPRYIIFWCISQYMTDEEISRFKNNIAKDNLTQDRRFLSTVHRYFNIERLVAEPVIKEDIWVYNYLKYEVKTKFPRNGLIAKYEREIVLPVEKEFKELIKDI